MKNQEQLFTFSLLAILLFFVLGVVPAMRFDDQVKYVVENVRTNINTQGIDFFQTQFKDIKDLQLEQQKDKLILRFKKPNYVFLFVNSEAQINYQKMLPREAEVQIL